jgi:hypothetical protein
MSDVRMITAEMMHTVFGEDAVGMPLVNGFNELRAWEVMAKDECFLMTCEQWEEYKRICDWKKN